MIKFYIVSHGNLSDGILDSVKLIAGDIKNIEALQLKPGGSPKNIASKIEEQVKYNNDTEYVIFTDLKGGSVHNAMLSLCVYNNVNIIAGFNLGMILDAVLTQGSDDIKGLIHRFIDIGKESIELFNKAIVEELLDKGGSDL